MSITLNLFWAGEKRENLPFPSFFIITSKLLNAFDSNYLTWQIFFNTYSKNFMLFKQSYNIKIHDMPMALKTKISKI